MAGSRPCNCILRASPAPSTPRRSRSIERPLLSPSPSTTRASLGWLPDEFKSERGTIKIDRFGRLGNTKFFAAGDVVQLGSGQPLMVVNAVGDGKRVAFNLDKVLRGERLQPQTIAVDVIFDLNRMNMTYFPHFPRVQQSLLAPASRRR